MSFIEELYYGNTNPNEKHNKKQLPYEKAARTFSDIESKLSKELNGDNVSITKHQKSAQKQGALFLILKKQRFSLKQNKDLNK